MRKMKEMKDFRKMIEIREMIEINKINEISGRNKRNEKNKSLELILNQLSIALCQQKTILNKTSLSIWKW